MRWRNGDLEGDLARNYHGDVLTLTAQARYHGWSGPRSLAADLAQRVPGGRITIGATRLGESVAVVAWSLADPSTSMRLHGVDGYFIRRGQILTQTRDVA